jgi:protein TonB
MYVRTFLLLFISLIVKDLSAQTTDTLVEKVYEPYELAKSPSFPGGEMELLKYFSQNFKLPEGIRPDSPKGTKLAMSFIVETSGVLTEMKILKDIGPGSGEETIRVLHSMPPWTPAEANGRPVRSRYVLPIQLELR